MDSLPAIDRIGIRNYALVTAAYWGFTITDGALRMLVLLYFHTLGYTPLEALLNSGMNLWSSRYWHIPKLEIVNQQSDGMLQHH